MGFSYRWFILVTVLFGIFYGGNDTLTWLEIGICLFSGFMAGINDEIYSSNSTKTKEEL